MDIKLVSKNNIGAVVLLLLVIALSQARVFNFLIDTALGRSFLIIFILCLSYFHKILGVVGVLFIIIMFNSNMSFEGFDTNSDSKMPSNSSDSTNSDSQSKMMMKQKMSNSNSNSNVDASNNNITTDDTSTDTDTSNINVITKPTKPSTSTASEGFDILGIENNIKRGKQSNSIPVNNFMRDSNSISPYEGSSFLGNFSPF